MRQRRMMRCLAIVTVLGVASMAAAGDDRTFLQETVGEPNIIFILDTSSSMVASPEVTMAGDPAVPSAVDGALVPAGMVPGGGDDPYSRMRIAKDVLGDFLTNIGDANFAFAGYAQAPPAAPDWPVARKHWVYEARAQDRYHMIESTYAYRMGYNENHAGVLLDVPADIVKRSMIGYKLYFDPETTPVTDRFGRENAFDLGYVDYTYTDPGPPVVQTDVYAPHDTMPLYFGNCFIDNKDTPEDDTDDSTVCVDRVFPVYDSGVRDSFGVLIPDTWYYGQLAGEDDDYPGCDPTSGIWDDGFGSPVPGACESEWQTTSGSDTIIHQRRVRLEIPETYSGAANHFLAVSDATGLPVGNTQVADGGYEDYDLDGYPDTDYDGDDTNDWILYVNSREQQRTQTCAPAAGLPTWTPSPTPTQTYTQTYTHTYTPTPIVDCSLITLGDPYIYSDDVRILIDNDLTPLKNIEIERTVIDWVPYRTPPQTYSYIDYIYLQYTSYQYYPGNYYDPHFDWTTGAAISSSYKTIYSGSNRVWGVDFSGSYSSSSYWYGTWSFCFDFLVLGGNPFDGSDWSCPNICTTQTFGGAPTPTQTYTQTSTPLPTSAPTNTRTNTPTGGVPSNTNTPTNTPAGPTPTNPPLPTATWTPFPPTPTHTPKPANTPTPIG